MSYRAGYTNTAYQLYESVYLTIVNNRVGVYKYTAHQIYGVVDSAIAPAIERGIQIHCYSDV